MKKTLATLMALMFVLLSVSAVAEGWPVHYDEPITLTTIRQEVGGTAVFTGENVSYTDNVWTKMWLDDFNIQVEYAGFDEIVLKPHFPKEIRHFSAWHNTPHGKVEICWNQDEYSVRLPQGICARVILEGQAECVICHSMKWKRNSKIYSEEEL